MNITICEKKNVLKFLQKEKYDAIISINDPFEKATRIWAPHRMNKWKEKVGKYVDPKNSLFLYFWDVVVPEFDGPTQDTITKLVEFAQTLNPSSKILIHCKMGISRSTAAAIIILNVNGMSLKDANEYVLRIRPHANPNSLMLQLYDEFYEKFL